MVKEDVTLWVFAGPPGSGKSTPIQNELRETPFFPRNYINPDDFTLSLARQMGVEQKQARSIAHPFADYLKLDILFGLKAGGDVKEHRLRFFFCLEKVPQQDYNNFREGMHDVDRG